MTDLVQRAVLKVSQSNVSNLDTSTDPMTIVQIPLNLIEPNSDNFYAVDNLDDLTESIEMIGLKQPLIVVLIDGRYRLIAGHRRYQALLQLGYDTAPCIIQHKLSKTDEQITLILTNSTTRELTYHEKMEQAKQLKELFIRRREEGGKLPGRIRDMVAEAMHESASNIARMEAIDRHLIDPWRTELNNNRISASTAYEICKLSDTAQKRLKTDYQDPKALTAQVVKSAAQMENYPFAPLNCPLHRGAPCTRYTERAEMVDNGTCPGCCNHCDHTDNCPALCGWCERKIERQKQHEKKAQKECEAEEHYQKSAYHKAQLSLMYWANSETFDHMESLPRIVKFFRGLDEPNHKIWSPDLSSLCDMADCLGISLVELLGLDQQT